MMNKAKHVPLSPELDARVHAMFDAVIEAARPFLKNPSVPFAFTPDSIYQIQGAGAEADRILRQISQTNVHHQYVMMVEHTKGRVFFHELRWLE